MANAIISATQLGKRYRFGLRKGHDTLRDLLTHGLRRLFQPRREPSGDAGYFWALKNVSFDIQQGEVVGVIGRNGAGKSTLLKILSQITEPTEGEVRIRGRVASLLEVGTGFHPELSGRENIFLNGAILGMSRAEIKRNFDEIVAFAEVEKFLDTPVKRYSSGMYVRLAFAVAAHLEPEILVVDEVLAVGDAQFQKKCLGKMAQVSSQQGRTVLFVSHNMVAVQSLCRRCLLLEKGGVKFDGGVAEGVSAYLQSVFETGAAHSWPDDTTAPGNDVVRMAKLAVEPEDTAPGARITMQEPFRIETEYHVRKNDATIHITYHLLNEQGLVVLTSGSAVRKYDTGRYRSICRFPGSLLNSGSYYLKLLIVEDGTRISYQNECLASFHVVDARERNEGWMGREPGIVQPNLEWTTTAVSETQPNSTR
jgi:lipopolysaccharide transport system ATP-binding protein